MDKITIETIERMPQNQLLKKIENRFNNYQPSKVRRREIPKPNGKIRPLGIPSLWDRLIQQCILQVLRTDNEEWKLILNTAKVKVEKNIREFSSAIEQITALLEDPKMDVILEQLSDLDISSFSSIELRTLCLTYFKEILIDFINDCHVTVDSKVVPFVSLETLLINSNA